MKILQFIRQPKPVALSPVTPEPAHSPATPIPVTPSPSPSAKTKKPTESQKSSKASVSPSNLHEVSMIKLRKLSDETITALYLRLNPSPKALAILALAAKLSIPLLLNLRKNRNWLQWAFRTIEETTHPQPAHACQLSVWFSFYQVGI